MPIPISLTWFDKRLSAEPSTERVRIGIPRVLNQWSTHRFWKTMFVALGQRPNDVVFSSVTSETQQRTYGQGRVAVDCCYPVKCLAGHYGELLKGQKRPIDVLFSPKIVSLPSFLAPNVKGSLCCPRVMAAPESAKATFLRESDDFEKAGVQYIAPVVALDEPALAKKQLFQSLAKIFPGLSRRRCDSAVDEAYRALEAFDREMRSETRSILEKCASANAPCVMALGRPYHMDPGIGHEIETELQAAGFPIIWGQYLPIDPDITDWVYFAPRGDNTRRSPFDISEIWPSSYSANTNEILWAAEFASRFPWIACVVRFASYECGMDQPTYTPVKTIVEESGTLFFSFQDLDATKPSGSVRIRAETIAYYVNELAEKIIARKLERLGGHATRSGNREAGHAGV